jgi:4-hydroxy-3-methylbut-2-en-1-yl diphosphate reductase
VLRDLAAHGIEFADRGEVPRTKAVLITAHGTSSRIRNQLRADGFDVAEATCPLVHFAHRALHQFISQGCHPVIIGRRDHVEVRGMTGDLEEFDVILDAADVSQLQPRRSFGIVAQTTQPIDRVRALVEQIRQRFPEALVRFRDTVCQPTKQRQSAAAKLAQVADAVVVIGGANSNNTRELVATCTRHCARVHHVQTASDLREEWFLGASTVGVTAGTSTPDQTIDEVEQWLHRLSAREFTREQRL